MRFSDRRRAADPQLGHRLVDVPGLEFVDTRQPFPAAEQDRRSDPFDDVGT